MLPPIDLETLGHTGSFLNLEQDEWKMMTEPLCADRYISNIESSEYLSDETDSNKEKTDGYIWARGCYLNHADV